MRAKEIELRTWELRPSKGWSAEQLHSGTGSLCLAKAAMETAGELRRAKVRLEARYQYNKGQSVKNLDKKRSYIAENGSLTLEVFVLSRVLL